MKIGKYHIRKTDYSGNIGLLFAVASHWEELNTYYVTFLIWTWEIYINK